MIDNKQSIYTYYAFISYKREDEKWAKWLQKKLESYGFPVALRKDNPALPTRIKPVFRDKTDLTSGNLKEEIENALRESKYLIVICSPRAAQSPWVSKEVQYFIDNGKENNIIPFIIGGIPNAKNPEEECFPEGLRQLAGEKEILGININDMGRNAAVIKVIACMFDLRFDTLWRSAERMRRRKRLFFTVMAVMFMLLSGSVTIYIYQQNTRLNTANKNIAEERDRVKAEKDRMLCEKAQNLIDEDSYGAAIIALDVLSRHDNDFPEAEAVLRLSSKINNITLRGHKFFVNDISFSPDSNHLASASHDQTVKIWDLNNGKCLKTFKYNSAVVGVSYIQNNAKLVSVTENGDIYIYDTTSKKMLRRHNYGIDTLENTTFSPNGKYAALTYSDNTILIIDAESLNTIIKVEHELEFSDQIRALSFNHKENQLCWIYYDDDYHLRILDILTGNISEKTLGYYNSDIMSTAYSSDDKKLAVACPNITNFFDALNLCTLDSISGESFSCMNYIKVDGNDILVTANEMGHIKAWNTYTNLPQFTIPTKENRINKIIFHPTQRYIAICGGNTNGNIRILDTSYIYGKLSELCISQYFENYIYDSCMGFSENETYAITKDLEGGKSHLLKFNNPNMRWDTIENAPMLNSGCAQPVNPFVGYGKYYINYSNNKINIWEVSTMKLIKSVSIAGEDINNLMVHPFNNNLFITRQNCILKFWNVNSLVNSNILPIAVHDLGYYFSEKPGDLDKIQLSLDLKYIYYIDSESVIKRIDLLKKSENNISFKNQSRYISQIRLSPDDAKLMIADADLIIHIYDLRSNSVVKSWIAHSNLIKEVLWHPTGNYVMSSAHDNPIIVWDIKSGFCVNKIDTYIDDVSFSPDGNCIYGNNGHYLVIYPFMPINMLINSNLKRFKERSLSQTEKKVYGLE